MKEETECKHTIVVTLSDSSSSAGLRACARQSVRYCYKSPTRLPTSLFSSTCPSRPRASPAIREISSSARGMHACSHTRRFNYIWTTVTRLSATALTTHRSCIASAFVFLWLFRHPVKVDRHSEMNERALCFYFGLRFRTRLTPAVELKLTFASCGGARV